MKKWKEENERREKELKEEHKAAITAHTEELTGQKDKATESMKESQEEKC